MTGVTQEQIDKAIKGCPWRKKIHGVDICKGMANPCIAVISRGECEVIKKLYAGGEEE